MSKAAQLSSFKQPFVCRFSSYITQQTITARVRSFPVKLVIFCTRGAALLCPGKLLCAVSSTGHGPSQLFTINITVALAAPLRSYFHYTRHQTNTGESKTISPKEPKREKLQYCHFLYNLSLFFYLKIQRKLAHLWAYPEIWRHFPYSHFIF